VILATYYKKIQVNSYYKKITDLLLSLLPYKKSFLYIFEEDSKIQLGIDMAVYVELYLKEYFDFNFYVDEIEQSRYLHIKLKKEYNSIPVNPLLIELSE
jgi:hypothetical protein